MTTQSPHRAWTQVLDELERDLNLALAQLADPDTDSPMDALAWTPLNDMPPMPPSVEERAMTLLNNQREVAAMLSARMRETRAQAGYADQVDRATRDHARPLYVDTHA